VSLIRRLHTPLLGVGAGLALAATPAFGHVEVSAKPGLRPGFQSAVTDYVSRCVAGMPLRMAVDASGGDRVSVAGRPERGGNFVTKVHRRTGESLSVRVTSRDGTVKDYRVRCLPQDFPDWEFARHGAPQAQWYITTPVKPPAGGYVAIFDTHGVPVWWRGEPSGKFMPWDAKLLDDGLMVSGRNFGNHFGVRKEGAFEERTLDGRLVRLVRTRGSPTDVHDLQRLPNGNLLGITYRRRDDVDLSAYRGSSHARVFDGEIQELAPSGNVVWRWNSKGHVSPSETGREWWYDGHGENHPPAERGYDLLHLNSVEPDGDGLVVSARALDAVFRIDRRTGDIDWKLGGSFVPGESLTVLGMPPGAPVFQGQHDARVLNDGTLTVFDNRTYSGSAPVADRFRIDPVRRTATRIEHVTELDVPRSQWGGSARKLPGGNWVVSWGGTRLITEQTPAGAVVLLLRFAAEHVTYRAQALPPGRVSAAELRRGMDHMAKTRKRA
jgi:Arylsulfotransferase (ASST)